MALHTNLGLIARYLHGPELPPVSSALGPSARAPLISGTGVDAPLGPAVSAALGAGAPAVFVFSASSMPPPVALSSLPRAKLEAALRVALSTVGSRAWLEKAPGVVRALLVLQAAAPTREEADALSAAAGAGARSVPLGGRPPLVAALRAPLASLVDMPTLFRGACSASSSAAEALGLFCAVGARLTGTHDFAIAPLSRALAAMRWTRAHMPGMAPEAGVDARRVVSAAPSRTSAAAAAAADAATGSTAGAPATAIDINFPLLCARSALLHGALSVHFDAVPALDTSAPLLALDLLIARTDAPLHAHFAALGVVVPAFALAWLPSVFFADDDDGTGAGSNARGIGIPITRSAAGARWVLATLLAEGWAGWTRVALAALLVVSEDLRACTTAADVLTYLATFPRRGMLSVKSLADTLAFKEVTPTVAAAVLLTAASLRVTLAMGGYLPSPSEAYVLSLDVTSGETEGAFVSADWHAHTPGRKSADLSALAACTFAINARAAALAAIEAQYKPPIKFDFIKEKLQAATSLRDESAARADSPTPKLQRAQSMRGWGSASPVATRDLPTASGVGVNYVLALSGQPAVPSRPLSISKPTSSRSLTSGALRDESPRAESASPTASLGAPLDAFPSKPPPRSTTPVAAVPGLPVKPPPRATTPVADGSPTAPQATPTSIQRAQSGPGGMFPAKPPPRSNSPSSPGRLVHSQSSSALMPAKPPPHFSPSQNPPKPTPREYTITLPTEPTSGPIDAAKTSMPSTPGAALPSAQSTPLPAKPPPRAATPNPPTPVPLSIPENAEFDEETLAASAELEMLDSDASRASSSRALNKPRRTSVHLESPDPIVVLEAAASSERPAGPRPASSSRSLSAGKAPPSPAFVLEQAGVRLGELHLNEETRGVLEKRPAVVSSKPRRTSVHFDSPDPVAVIEAAVSPERPAGPRPAAAARAVSVKKASPSPAFVLEQAGVRLGDLELCEETRDALGLPRSQSVGDSATTPSAKAALIRSPSVSRGGAAAAAASPATISSKDSSSTSVGRLFFSAGVAAAPTPSHSAGRAPGIRRDALAPGSPLLGTIPTSALVALAGRVSALAHTSPLGVTPLVASVLPPPTPPAPASSAPTSRSASAPVAAVRLSASAMASALASPREPALPHAGGSGGKEAVRSPESLAADDRLLRAFCAPEFSLALVPPSSPPPFVVRMRGVGAESGSVLNSVVGGLIGSPGLAYERRSTGGAAYSSLSKALAHGTEEKKSARIAAVLQAGSAARNDEEIGEQLLDSVRSLRAQMNDPPSSPSQSAQSPNAAAPPWAESPWAEFAVASGAPALTARWNGDVIDFEPLATSRASPAPSKILASVVAEDSKRFDAFARAARSEPALAPALAASSLLSVAGASPLRGAEELLASIRATPLLVTSPRQTPREARLRSLTELANAESASASRTKSALNPAAVSALFDSAVREGLASDSKGWISDGAPPHSRRRAPPPPPVAHHAATPPDYLQRGFNIKDITVGGKDFETLLRRPAANGSSATPLWTA